MMELSEPRLNVHVISPVPPNDAALRMRDDGDSVVFEILNGRTGLWASRSVISTAEAKRLGVDLANLPSAAWRAYGEDVAAGLRLSAVSKDTHLLVIMTDGMPRDCVLLSMQDRFVVKQLASWLAGPTARI